MEKLTIIPFEAYTAMLGKCNSTQLVYALLKNGIIKRNSDGNDEVQILCNEKTSKEIADFAATDCPEVSPFIKIAVRPA